MTERKTPGVWPDPSRPGYPPNPERGGPFVLRRLLNGQEEFFEWRPGPYEGWEIPGSDEGMLPQHASKDYAFVCRMLTATEVATLLAAERSAGMQHGDESYGTGQEVGWLYGIEKCAEACQAVLDEGIWSDAMPRVVVAACIKAIHALPSPCTSVVSEFPHTSETPGAWPDPLRPGVPLREYEMDRLHILLTEENSFVQAVGLYSCVDATWTIAGEAGRHPATSVAMQFRYGFPALTPAEVSASVAEAVAAEREDIMTAIRTYRDVKLPPHQSFGSYDGGLNMALDAIRALPASRK